MADEAVMSLGRGPQLWNVPVIGKLVRDYRRNKQRDLADRVSEKLAVMRGMRPQIYFSVERDENKESHVISLMHKKGMGVRVFTFYINKEHPDQLRLMLGTGQVREYAPRDLNAALRDAVKEHRRYVMGRLH